jgi:hypothetical protein
VTICEFPKIKLGEEREREIGEEEGKIRRRSTTLQHPNMTEADAHVWIPFVSFSLSFMACASSTVTVSTFNTTTAALVRSYQRGSQKATS